MREQWSSKFGFILATAGSAVGLANVWAFPFRTGENGGAAFVLVYIGCIFLICLPFMFGELAIGRFTQKNAVGAIRDLAKGRAWIVLGILCISAGIFILSFYAVVAGWSFGYIFKMLFGEQSTFGEFAGKPVPVLSVFLIFLILNMAVVYRGVQQGIERWSKILMPTLILLTAGLIIYGLTLPRAAEGLRFFLQPDFSKIDAGVLVTAMGQAFFSLSLGIGGILTYGSYLSKKENIVTSAVWIAVLDTTIALMAGLMIFPALFSFGGQPNEGPALVFVILPEIFTQLPLGNFVGAVFFVLLTIAALTSTISLSEIPIAFFVDEKRGRKKIVWVLGAVVFVLGIPSALSQGAVPALSSLDFFGGRSLLEFMIFLWFDIFPPLGAILFSILIGWVWGADNAAEELQRGSRFEKKLLGRITTKTVWGFFIRYICPLLIALVWLNAVFFS